MSGPGQFSAGRTETIRGGIRDHAFALGFDAVGFAGADSGDAAGRLREFIASGYHGDMGWMETTQARRESPRGLWPEVKSIIAVGMNYGPDEDPLLLQGHPDRAVVSTYARGCAALHFLSDDRTRWTHPPRIPDPDGQPDLRLRRLSRGVPVEQVRESDGA